MKFPSEAIRLEHPKARLIPRLLWDSDKIFGSELAAYELAMMTIDLTTTHDLASTSAWAAASQLRCWLCLLLGHSGAPAADLLLAAQRVYLPSDIIFKGAVLANRSDIVDAIKTDTREIKMAISADSYFVFRLASALGYWASLIRLARIAPELKMAMIVAVNYHAFRYAAANGHIAVLDWHKAETPRQLQAMILANECFAFRAAAHNGHLDVLKWLNAMAPGRWQEMMAINRYHAFRGAAGNEHFAVTQYLLSFPASFAYAEMYDDIYGERFVHPLIQEKLTSLRSQRLAAEAANPLAVFDIADANDPQFCFYIIRNLIRRNDPALLDDIRFLLKIPAVKALSHQPVTAGYPNELLRLALTTGNRVVAEILLNTRELRELAKYHDYYRAEAHAKLDLDALVRDRESSMHVLSSGEQTRLAAVIEHYQPVMRALGIKDLFKHLRDTLVARYKAHPATIIVGGVTTVLPVDWETFTHLALTGAQCKEALKAYYQHKDHSALRYVSRPNPWMAADLSYVYCNTKTRESWSTFEEYMAPIVILWLAAHDKTKEPTDGFTLEGRVTHFIGELAHIARARNRGRRIIAGRSGAPTLDKDGHAIEEEYDDLAGDKPGYYLERHFVQLVPGHPLLKILTKEDIKKELDDFIRAHFTCRITDKNRERFRKAWLNYSASMDLLDAEFLVTLNISVEQRVEFVLQLTAKYGRQFSDNDSFRRIIEDTFALVNNGSNPSGSMHALKFERLINLGDLLQDPATTALVSATPAARGGAGAPRSIGFFPGSAAERDDAPAVNCCVVQ